jgi:hypothetical protein
MRSPVKNLDCSRKHLRRAGANGACRGALEHLVLGRGGGQFEEFWYARGWCAEIRSHTRRDVRVQSRLGRVRADVAGPARLMHSDGSSNRSARRRGVVATILEYESMPARRAPVAPREDRDAGLVHGSDAGSRTRRIGWSRRTRAARIGSPSASRATPRTRRKSCRTRLERPRKRCAVPWRLGVRIVAVSHRGERRLPEAPAETVATPRHPAG